MTTQIELNEVLDSVRLSPTDSEGYVNTALLLSKLALKYDCKVLTIRNFISKHSSYFDSKHGRMRLREEAQIPQQIQKDAQAEFQVWHDERCAYLDEIVQFLSTRQDPYMENLLIQIALAREELSSYSDAKLCSIDMDLRRDYGFVPKTELKIVA